MVSCDEVDGAVAQALPQDLAVGAATDGGRAFEQRGSVGDILCCEVQVMGAGLAGDRQTLCPRGLQLRQSQRSC